MPVNPKALVSIHSYCRLQDTGLTYLGHHFKHRISSPFDFQHLTHTDRHQFAALEQASENDLVAEFRAVRASQAPRRDLTGIKADDLHFSNFSSENLASMDSRSPSAFSTRSPPQSPESSQESYLPEPPRQDFSQRTVRTCRSVESFSQPAIAPRSHRHTQSSNVPPPGASRLPLAPIDDLPEDSSDIQRFPSPTRTRSNRQSGMWAKFAPLSPAIENSASSMVNVPDFVGHAVTTPDDSAIHPVSPPFTPGLEDVAEEPERFVSPRPAPAPPMRAPVSPRSPYFESFSFRNNQRSPISRSSSRGSSFTSPKSFSQRAVMTRPISQMSDTLGSPVVSRRNSIRRAPTVRRKSNTWRVLEESWEDDVDFIYDNALEADCDFDWEHTSDDGAVFEDRDRTPEQHDHERPSPVVSTNTRTPLTTSDEEPTVQTRFFASSFRPSLLVPSPTSVPELESRSAVSASTADTGARTPLEFFNPLTPSLLDAPEFKENPSREQMYEDILADYEASDRHYPLIDASQSIASSTRSSRVRSSKRSSYDSSLMSFGLTSTSWGSPIRRSASSSGSLPELVHSRLARKDVNVMVDQLNEQVASLSTSGEDDTVQSEDNDTTPPGRPSQERTFFASDEEDRQAHLRASIEGEVRASLELARRGSQRSSRAPLHYHKYASSDSAAKLLDSPMSDAPEGHQSTNRNRAASSSKVVRGNRPQYLSLFPIPPKHMRLATPTSTPTSPLDSSSHNS